MPGSPTVSINLCCYNSEKYLRETLDSIVCQTYKDWELVIINDGSKDSTESIIKEYIDQGYPIIYCWQENHGLAYSRNKALKLSNGGYIAFIDHDDIWLPNKLDEQMRLFSINKELGLVYSDCYNLYAEGSMIPVSNFLRFHRGWVFKEMLAANFIVLSTAIAKKDALEKNGYFPNYKISEEYALFLKIASEYPIDYVNKPLASYRYHDNNASRDLEVNLREVEEIMSYWSLNGDANVKKICIKALANACYGFSRRALFHLREKQTAIILIKKAIQYNKKIEYYSFHIMCLLPLSVSNLFRNILIYRLSSKIGHDKFTKSLDSIN